MMMPSDTLVDAAQVIAAAAGGLDTEAVAKAVATAGRYWLRDPVLRGEFSQIVSRYGSFFPSVPVSAAEHGTAVSVIAHYFNPRFAPGQSAFRSIRFRNNTDTVFSSDGAQPFFLSYFLCDAAGNRVSDGPRSRLPIDLESQQELTVPMLISAPLQPGRYRIRVMLVQEHVR